MLRYSQSAIFALSKLEARPNVHDLLLAPARSSAGGLAPVEVKRGSSYSMVAVNCSWSYGANDGPSAHPGRPAGSTPENAGGRGRKRQLVASTPFGRLGQPSDVAALLFSFASDHTPR